MTIWKKNSPRFPCRKLETPLVHKLLCVNDVSIRCPSTTTLIALLIQISCSIIRRSFLYLSADILIPLYKALARSHFDYAMIIWNPHLVKHIESIEGVQRRATKMILEIKHLPYSERLQILKLPTMAYRRARGDMIEVFKIVAHIYDSKTTSNVLNFREKLNISLRGHEFTLEHKRLSCPARVHFFTNRIVNNWNSLPDHIVNAGSLNVFKNLLDRLWAIQDILYNYRGVIEKKLYVI